MDDETLCTRWKKNDAVTEYNAHVLTVYIWMTFGIDKCRILEKNGGEGEEFRR